MPLFLRQSRSRSKRIRGLLQRQKGSPDSIMETAS
nr:MAG TPA: hypothetical protein [Caudoviricetes sp.]DAX27928.1 MAG TPA: hypothetical protein [Caudoviricetes sp.]